MNFFKQNIALILLFTIGSVYAKRTGTIQTPITQPTQPRTPVIQPQQTPVIEKGQQFPFQGARYTEILYILESKTPDSSDFSTLRNIKHEAELQMKFIQERKPDLRAKRWVIRNAADIETYSDILTALQQNTPDSSDFSTLKNIITEVDRQIQSIQSRGKKPIIQPIQPVTGELRYTEILSALKQNVPDSSDFSTLNNIITEATRQRDQLIRK